MIDGKFAFALRGINCIGTGAGIAPLITPHERTHGLEISGCPRSMFEF
jgi:hypothetical protein